MLLEAHTLTYGEAPIVEVRTVHSDSAEILAKSDGDPDKIPPTHEIFAIDERAGRDAGVTSVVLHRRSFLDDRDFESIVFKVDPTDPDRSTLRMTLNAAARSRVRRNPDRLFGCKIVVIYERKVVNPAPIAADVVLEGESILVDIEPELGRHVASRYAKQNTNGAQKTANQQREDTR